MTVRASSKDVCSVSFSQRSGLVLEDNYDNLLSAAMLHVPSRLEISPETFTLFRDVVDEHGAMLADDVSFTVHKAVKIASATLPTVKARLIIATSRTKKED